MTPEQFNKLPEGNGFLTPRAANPDIAYHSLHFPEGTNPAQQLPEFIDPSHAAILLHIIDLYPSNVSISKILGRSIAGQIPSGVGQYSSTLQAELRVKSKSKLRDIEMDKLVTRNTSEGSLVPMTRHYRSGDGMYIPTITGFHIAVETARRRLNKRNTTRTTEAQAKRIIAKGMPILFQYANLQNQMDGSVHPEDCQA